MCRLIRAFGQRFVEPEPVAERVNHLQAPRPVEGLLYPGPHDAVAVGDDFQVVFIQATYPEEDGGTRTAIAMVAGQVKHAPRTRHLQVQRRPFVEPVLAVHRETEEPDVELAGLLLAEDA